MKKINKKNLKEREIEEIDVHKRSLEHNIRNNSYVLLPLILYSLVKFLDKK